MMTMLDKQLIDFDDVLAEKNRLVIAEGGPKKKTAAEFAELTRLMAEVKAKRPDGISLGSVDTLEAVDREDADEFGGN